MFLTYAASVRKVPKYGGHYEVIRDRLKSQ